jgi:hypothetical protein
MKSHYRIIEHFNGIFTVNFVHYTKVGVWPFRKLKEHAEMLEPSSSKSACEKAIQDHVLSRKGDEVKKTTRFDDSGKLEGYCW